MLGAFYTANSRNLVGNAIVSLSRFAGPRCGWSVA